jgi:hypothetical protein
MTGGETLYARDRDKFEARRKLAELDSTDLGTDAAIVHVPLAPEPEFDGPTTEEVKRIYNAAAHEIVQLLYANHYTILAFRLKRQCLEAILDGLDEASVKQLAEEGLKDADPILYQYHLRKPDLSDVPDTL